MTAANNPRHDNLTVDTIAAALTYIDANVSREKWARIGMAIKAELGDAGFGLFDDWSQTGEGYNAKDCASTYKSIKAGGGVNIGTLIYQAQQNGFELGDDRQTLSADEIEKRRRQREQERAAAEADMKRLQGEAAKLANLTWDAATPATDGHPYLKVKGVRSHGLAIGEWPLINDKNEVFRRRPNVLLVPIMDAKNGKTISLQGIYQDDDGEIQKRYLKNGRKRGGFHMIGRPPEAGQILAFAEGYATGATIHELTGWPVIVTFDAPNLAVVAQALRGQFPQAVFAICADNDAWTKAGDIANPGMHYGQVAAQATNGFVIAPRFTDTSERPTDWNDLAKLEGDDTARTQLLANPVSGRGGSGLVEAPKTTPKTANDNVDYFTPLPHMGMKGKPLSTIENVAEIMDRLGATVRYNMISKNQEIILPNEGFSIDNQDGASYARLESECARFMMATDKLQGALLVLADQNQFNPVVQWVTSKPWDKKPRLQALCDTVVPVEDRKLADGRSLKDVLIKRWMVSAIAAAFNPEGVNAHGILVFQGPQYLGKTHWFKQLAPASLGVLKDGLLLNPADRDSVKKAVSFWLVELGELDATFRKADVAALKSFATQQTDVLRLPYAKRESTFARRTVFFGSVNPRTFLHDSTGNRRYWTVECLRLDLEAQAQLDMQQVWAEAYHHYQLGFGHLLTGDEMEALNAHNEEFQAIDPVEERVQTRLDWEVQTNWTWKTATDILLMIGVDRPTVSDATKAANMVRKMNGGQGRRSNGKNLLWCPPKVGAFGPGGEFESQPF